MDFEANLTLKKYGKSFYWARLFLSRDIGSSATTLYSFCRLLDDIADGDLPGGADRLVHIDEQLRGVVSAKEIEVCHFLRLANKEKLNLEIARQLVLGLIGDQNKVLTQSKHELIKYSYRVAGTVGLMMAPILGAQDNQAEPFAIDLGIAMQLTNISRDLLEDARLGRRYIPAHWCDQITPKEIIQIALNPNEKIRRNILKTSIDRLLFLAEDYYVSGLSGLSYLPSRSHLSIGIAAFVYRAIGEKLRKRNLEWWQGRQVVNIAGKVYSSIRFLPELHTRLKKPLNHNRHLHRELKGLPGANFK